MARPYPNDGYCPYAVCEFDLSNLAGRGVFQAGRVAADGGIAWGDEIKLCPDALYLRLTGKSVEEFLPGVMGTSVDA